MSGTSEAVGRFGWVRHDTVRLMDALPLVDEPLTDSPRAPAAHRMHWIPAVVALALFLLARFDLLPAMPW
jgi:hypothetical protein